MSTPSSEVPPWEAIPKWPRRAITAWLLFHLVAVISAPASVGPASQLSRTVWSIGRPYLQMLYLNHGYHFFAPDPGESTLLAYSVERSDGTAVAGTIPDRRISPRLLYHRYFMLTESLAFVAGFSEALETSEEARPSAEDAVDSLANSEVAGESAGQPPAEARGLLGDWYESYADCLLSRFDGERVRLTRVVHYLPEMESMQDGIARGEPLTLDEPQSFAEFPVGTFQWTEHGTRSIEQEAGSRESGVESGESAISSLPAPRSLHKTTGSPSLWWGRHTPPTTGTASDGLTLSPPDAGDRP